MKKNMGTADRAIRAILGVIFLALYFTGTVSGGWGLVLLIVGVVFLLTSFASVCPAYVPMGVNTCGDSAET